MLINIITACSRPSYYIKALQENIKQTLIKSEARWYIIFDNRKIRTPKFIPECYHHAFVEGDISGAPQKNYALDIIKEGWVYILDDDNLLNLNFEKILLRRIKSKATGIVFDQMSNGKVRLAANPKKVGPAEIDCAQFILKREAIGDVRFEVNKYDSDGWFFREIYKNNKNNILFSNEPLTNYNALRSNDIITNKSE